jgi:serine/threonine-protein kinase
MADVLERLKAALADRYTIERELGSGGMATVYLAEDLKHHRKVAVKVLRPELAAVLGAERFLKEIEVTAHLQHPHILPLFDSGEADSFLYYVMPHVEGESLRDKLNREKQLAVEESIEIARGVASALDYAHRQDVIHRDIKPENILLHDGQPVVADFGIALAVSAAAGTRLTETGLSVGTPHYMSPEQASADRELDGRTDVYSLGATLYEMLAGQPPFIAPSAQAVVAKILTEEPRPVTVERQSVPPHVEATIHKALAKLPADRFTSGAEFANALTNPALAAPLPRTGYPTAEHATTWNKMTVAFAVLSAVLVGVLAVVLLVNPSVPSGGGVTRMSLRMPPDEALNVTGYPSLALAPDGRRFVYVGPGGVNRQLWLRSLGQLDATPLRGTEQACCAVFSPDGQSLAYLTVTPGRLNVVSLGGGPARTVADSGLSDLTLYGGGVAWADDGSLYVAGLEGLLRINPQDGSREAVTRLDAARGDRTHASPDVLPNGRGALVTVIPREVGGPSAYRIGIADLRTGAVEIVLQGVYARYATSGHVVFVQDDGSLLAAPFDQNRVAVTGPAVPLADLVRMGPVGTAQLALSDEGTLLYATGAQTVNRMVWVDRNGNEEDVDPSWTGVFTDPELSPDGSRLGLSNTTTDGTHIWIKPVDGGPASRLTFEGSTHLRTTWTPDGQAVFFVSDRSGIAAIYRQQADGSAAATRVPIDDGRPIFGIEVSRDGHWLIVRTDNEAPGRGDILALPLDGDGVLRELVATPAEEISPSLSPDGRWLAYVSDESGRREVYVRPFPNTNDARWQVSTEGGGEPLWAHSGRELFYRDANDNLVAAGVVTEPTFSRGAQRTLFSAAEYDSQIMHRNYDISGDDQRFLMIGRDTTYGEGELILVQNFFEELKERVGRGND